MKLDIRNMLLTVVDGNNISNSINV